MHFSYLCTRKVEGETGAAEEQPASNRLSVLRCNSKRRDGFKRPSLLFTCCSCLALPCLALLLLLPCLALLLLLPCCCSYLAAFIGIKKAPHPRNSRQNCKTLVAVARLKKIQLLAYFSLFSSTKQKNIARFESVYLTILGTYFSLFLSTK